MVARQFFPVYTLNPSCYMLNPSGRVNWNGMANKPTLGSNKNLPYHGPKLAIASLCHPGKSVMAAFPLFPLPQSWSWVL